MKFPILKSILSSLAKLNPLRAVLWSRFWLTNRWRQRTTIDYVLLTLSADMPTIAEPRDWIRKRVLGPPPLSLTELDRMLERIGNDPRPKGVILNLRALAMPLAGLQTLRNSLSCLQAKGKKIICFAQSYSNGLYYLASIADEIILQPGGELETIGLRAEATFLKDALDTVGVALDSIAISPYKAAFDQFSRSEISPEGQAQLDWLLDSQFDMLLHTIADGRKMSHEAVRAMIDHAPYLDEEALAAGYVDAVETEEALHRRLASKHILPLHAADKKLLKIWRKSSDKYVALINISGLMVQGESGSPPIELPVPFVGGQRAGDLTVVQHVRRLMQDNQAAAVILYINSGGGSAIAAEAMTSALAELAQDRPLVAFMDRIAASGGYYVATPAQWIVAQPATITGSIGVISAKAVTTGLFGKLRVNRREFTRGTNAALMSDHAPFSDAQRARMFKTIDHIYQQFIGHVARSRKLSIEQVDAVGGGRVWTGTQALANGLVNELGDLRTALQKARELANLPDHAPLVLVGGKGKPLPAKLAEQANPATIWQYLHENVQLVSSGTPLMMMDLDINI
ncbi:MAG: S49 family peptidase [Anaerolineae bacterium]